MSRGQGSTGCLNHHPAQQRVPKAVVAGKRRERSAAYRQTNVAWVETRAWLAGAFPRITLKRRKRGLGGTVWGLGILRPSGGQPRVSKFSRRFLTTGHSACVHKHETGIVTSRTNKLFVDEELFHAVSDISNFLPLLFFSQWALHFSPTVRAISKTDPPQRPQNSK